MLAYWLQEIIISNLHHEIANTEVQCYIKSGDGTHAYKSECVTEKAPTAIPGDWRMRLYN